MIMEYQKIINLLHNKTNQPAKFRIKKLVKINNEECGTYNANSQIESESSMLRSNLCDYSDAYILVSGTITVEIIIYKLYIKILLKRNRQYTNR